MPKNNDGPRAVVVPYNTLAGPRPALWNQDLLTAERDKYCANDGFAMDVRCFFSSLHVFGKDDSVVEGGTGEMKKIEEEK